MQFIYPDKIYRDFLRNKIDKIETINYLQNFIENSNSIYIRIRAIKLIEIIGLNNDDLFKTIEQAFLSDENLLVRAVAAKVIFSTFLDKGLNLLVWSIVNFKDPFILRSILDLIITNKDIENQPPIQELIKEFHNFAENLGIVLDEIKFILDLESIFAEGKKNYKIDIEPYKYSHLYSIEENRKTFESASIISKGVNIDNYWESWIASEKGHIIALNFKQALGTKWSLLGKRLPNSIGSLPRLKYLNLSQQKLVYIPASIGVLSNLIYLDLSENELINLPESIGSLLNLRLLNLRFNKLNSLPESIRNLKYSWIPL